MDFKRAIYIYHLKKIYIFYFDAYFTSLDYFQSLNTYLKTIRNGKKEYIFNTYILDVFFIQAAYVTVLYAASEFTHDRIYVFIFQTQSCFVTRILVIFTQRGGKAIRRVELYAKLNVVLFSSLYIIRVTDCMIY